MKRRNILKIVTVLGIMPPAIHAIPNALAHGTANCGTDFPCGDD